MLIPWNLVLLMMLPFMMWLVGTIEKYPELALPLFFIWMAVVARTLVIQLEARKARWKIQTYLSAKGHLENYVIPKLGHLKATSVRFVDVETAGGEWGKKISAETVNKIYADINRVYKFTRKLGVRTNPMADVEKLVERASSRGIESSSPRRSSRSRRR